MNAQQWQRNNRWKSCYRIVPRSRLDGKREMVVLHKRKDEKGRGSDDVVKTEGGIRVVAWETVRRPECLES